MEVQKIRRILFQKGSLREEKRRYFLVDKNLFLKYMVL